MQRQHNARDGVVPACAQVPGGGLRASRGAGRLGQLLRPHAGVHRPRVKPGGSGDRWVPVVSLCFSWARRAGGGGPAPNLRWRGVGAPRVRARSQEANNAGNQRWCDGGRACWRRRGHRGPPTPCVAARAAQVLQRPAPPLPQRLGMGAGERGPTMPLAAARLLDAPRRCAWPVAAHAAAGADQVGRAGDPLPPGALRLHARCGRARYAHRPLLLHGTCSASLVAARSAACSLLEARRQGRPARGQPHAGA